MKIDASIGKRQFSIAPIKQEMEKAASASPGYTGVGKRTLENMLSLGQVSGHNLKKLKHEMESDPTVMAFFGSKIHRWVVSQLESDRKSAASVKDMRSEVGLADKKERNKFTNAPQSTKVAVWANNRKGVRYIGESTQIHLTEEAVEKIRSLLSAHQMVLSQLEAQYGKMTLMGRNGIASLYLSTNGSTVFKITHNTEGERWKTLVGKRLNHFPRTYEVLKIDGFWVIIREYVAPIDQDQAEDMETLFVAMDSKYKGKREQSQLMLGAKDQKFATTVGASVPMVFKQLVSMSMEAKSAGLGDIDITSDNIGKKGKLLVNFDPFSA